MCGKVRSRHEKYICKKCREDLLFIRGKVCCQCGRPIDLVSEGKCADCVRIHHHFDGSFSPFEYKDKIRNSILAFKYAGRAEYGEFYAAAIWAYGKEKIREWKPDLILPVPAHAKRVRERGYNQAALIARGVSAFSQIPVQETLVKRVKKTLPQNKLDREERFENSKDAFQVNEGYEIPETILIVDDILTTGSTADALAQTLKNAGAKKVYLCTACVDLF